MNHSLNLTAMIIIFFGAVIIDCSHSNQLSLIDGQQRTTTFLLLLKALLLHINKIIPKIVDDEVLRGLKSGLEDGQKVIMSILYRAKPIDVVDVLENTEKIKNILILQNNSINELHHDELNKIIEAENFDIAQKNAFKIPRKQKDNQYTNHFRSFKFFMNNWLVNQNHKFINLLKYSLMNVR